MGNGQEDGKDLRISYLDVDMLLATRESSFILVIEAEDFHIKNPTKSKVFYNHSIYRFREQSLKKL